jgi:hypothetical protein
MICGGNFHVAVVVQPTGRRLRRLCLRKRRRVRTGSIGIVLALASLAAALAICGEPATDSQGPLTGAWKVQHLQFYYFSHTSMYSCDGLRDKVRALLMELGAGRDLRVESHGCFESNGPTRAPGLSIMFKAPILVDAGRPSDLPTFAVRFAPFSLTRDVFRNLDYGDCELIEEFVRQILPKLTTRELVSKVSCIPHAAFGSRFSVRGQVLKVASDDQSRPGSR